MKRSEDTSHARRNHMTCQDCDNSIPGSKWHTIRAGDQGWFFTQDGKAYCPEHVPIWVAEWRARNAKSQMRVDKRAKG